jgi:predicted nucleotidyltransferase
MTDFAGLIRRLVDSQVEFVLVGGVAATIHGSARLTQDIDLVYSRSLENLARLVTSLSDLTPYLRDVPPGLPFRWDLPTIERGLNFTLTCSLGELDLLGEIVGGGRYEDLLPHSFVIHVFGVDCRCLDLATLISTKRAAGRPKDLDVIAELEAIDAERRTDSNAQDDA